MEKYGEATKCSQNEDSNEDAQEKDVDTKEETGVIEDKKEKDGEVEHQGSCSGLYCLG